MANTPDPQPPTASYLEGCIDGLTEAADFLCAAPTMTHGARWASDAGFPRVLDAATNPDGDPSYVANVYALRDAALAEMWRAVDLLRDQLKAAQP